jgi:hypothetical protein
MINNKSNNGYSCPSPCLCGPPAWHHARKWDELGKLGRRQGLAFVVDMLGEVCMQTLEQAHELSLRQLVDGPKANTVVADGLETAVCGQGVHVNKTS